MQNRLPLRLADLESTDRYVAVISSIVVFALACLAGTGAVLGRWFIEDQGLRSSWPATFWTRFDLTSISLLFVAVMVVHAAAFQLRDKRIAIVTRVIVAMLVSIVL